MSSHAVSAMSRLTGLLLDGLAAQRDAGQVWHLWSNERALGPPVNVRRSADLLEVIRPVCFCLSFSVSKFILWVALIPMNALGWFGMQHVAGNACEGIQFVENQ